VVLILAWLVIAWDGNYPHFERVFGGHATVRDGDVE